MAPHNFLIVRHKLKKMVQDVSAIGIVSIGFLGFSVCWISSSTILFILWTTLTVFYAKNRWGERWLSFDQHASFNEVLDKQHEVRKRSNKSPKKYAWDAYDSTFNDHWRQRLMSYSAMPAMSSQPVKISPMHASTPRNSPKFHARYPTPPELHKSRNSMAVSVNKSPVKQGSKIVTELGKSDRSTSVKQFQPSYGLGVYPKVTLNAPKPLLLTESKSHMMKSAVTVRLHPTQRPTQLENELSASKNVELSLVSNLKKSSRKRHLKTKQTNTDHKKKRLDSVCNTESQMQESLVPDHFIEDVTTATKALKQLEKVHNVLVSPKTNAIDSSLSSMRKYRAKDYHNPLKRRRCEREIEIEETSRTKIIRQDVSKEKLEPSPTASAPTGVFQNVIEVNCEQIKVLPMEMELEPLQTEFITESAKTRQLYIPTLQDHLDDRKDGQRRLQQILKKIVVAKEDSLPSSPVSPSDSKKTFGTLEDETKTQVVEVTSTTTLENKATDDATTEKDGTFNQTISSAITKAWSPILPLSSGVVSLDTTINLSANSPTSTPVTWTSTASKPSPTESLKTKVNLVSSNFSVSKPLEINENNKRPTVIEFGNVSPIKPAPAFEFGAKTANGGGVFTFGATNSAPSTVSNGFQFSTPIQPFTFGGLEPSKSGSQMFSMGSGSTGPRQKNKLSASRSRVR